MNVLITSAGRRVSLVRAFGEAVASRGWRVLAGDTDSLAPSLQVADEGLLLPRLDDASYLDVLLESCQSNEVGLVVPTIDTELPLLAGARESFASKGIVILVSGRQLIDATLDKNDTEEVFGKKGIRMPRSWPVDAVETADLPATVFVKPRRGSASANTHLVQASLVSSILPLVPDPIVQEHIDATELTIDALLGLDGEIIHYVPRIRLKTVGGESVQGVTIDDAQLRGWIVEVLGVVSGLGGIGPMTLQAFQTDPEPTLIEVNPRFGGGFPLALAAGGQYPEWVLQMVEGLSVAPRIGSYQKGLQMTRALVEWFVDPEAEA